MFPDEVKRLITKRNNARRTYQRNPTPDNRETKNRTTAEARSAIKKYKNDKWNNLLTAAKTQDNSIWKLTKKLKNARTPIYELEVNRQKTNDPLLKSESFATHFEAVHVTDITSRQHYDLINEQITDYLNNNPPSVSNRLLNKIKTNSNELRGIIKYLGNKKAPGVDQITNPIIKSFSNRILDFFASIINACFKHSYFPKKR